MSNNHQNRSRNITTRQMLSAAQRTPESDAETMARTEVTYAELVAERIALRASNARLVEAINLIDIPSLPDDVQWYVHAALAAAKGAK